MVPVDNHDWITFHRVQFPHLTSPIERRFPSAQGVKLWRFGPEPTLGADGNLVPGSEIWGGFSLWSSRAEAEDMISDPIAAMPWLSDTAAAWHCLAVPVLHRGEVNWRGTVESGTAIRPAATDPGGQLAIMTSAGFDVVNPQTMPRIMNFLYRFKETMDWFLSQPSNLRSSFFSATHEGRDGVTFSLWTSDEAMMQSAYHPGKHRDRIDDDRAGLMSDRTSFTRLRVLKSHGDWDGDPFGMA